MKSLSLFTVVGWTLISLAAAAPEVVKEDPHGVPDPEIFPTPDPLAKREHIHHDIVRFLPESVSLKAINPGFDADLYQQLRGQEGNVFFSPYSITEAMGMVYLGADKNTADEIRKAMSYEDQQTYDRRVGVIRNQVLSCVNWEKDKLSVANALCITGHAPAEVYQSTVRGRFGGEIFAGDLDKINGWVKEKTEGNIDKILDKLSPNSRCVLLNAVYFKGNWKHPFSANKTRDGKFHVTPEKSVKAKLMSRRGSFTVARGKGWVAVELPYQGSASMVLILPENPEGMDALEKSVSKAMLKEVRNQLDIAANKPEAIELVMPKFKIETSYDLVQPFKEMGMVEAFDLKRANFSNMYTDNMTYISQVKHKATLEVDEMGSVASAATAVEMAYRGMPAPRPQIRFDRPFLTLIQDRNTQSTLFIGRISDPTK